MLFRVRLPSFNGHTDRMRVCFIAICLTAVKYRGLVTERGADQHVVMHACEMSACLSSGCEMRLVGRMCHDCVHVMTEPWSLSKPPHFSSIAIVEVLDGLMT